MLRCCSLLLLGKVVWFDSFILLFGAGTSNNPFELLYHIRILHYVSMKTLRCIEKKFHYMTRIKRVFTTQDLVIIPQFSTFYIIKYLFLDFGNSSNGTQEKHQRRCFFREENRKQLPETKKSSKSCSEKKNEKMKN